MQRTKHQTVGMGIGVEDKRSKKLSLVGESSQNATQSVSVFAKISFFGG